MKLSYFIYVMFTNVVSYVFHNNLISRSKSLSRRYIQLSASTNSIEVLIEQSDFGKGFQLPMKTSNFQLELKNKHPNDEYLTFHEREHQYFYHNNLLPKSVTQIITKYFEVFEANKAIDKMMNGNNWPRSQYMHPDGTPFTRSQIILQWDRIGELARNQGTWMHYNIERFLNGLDVSNSIPEMKQFITFYESIIIQQQITPYRTEWRIAAPDLGLGGSIDFVGKCSDGSYVLMDWKRSKSLPVNIYTNYNKYGIGPLKHMPDCDGSKYALQLNIYRYILMKYYNISISKMILASFHPDNEEYFMEVIPILEKETNDVLNDINL